MPSAIALIGGGFVLVAIVVSIAGAYRGYRSRGPAREAARARPVTFTAPVTIRLGGRSDSGIYGPGVDLANLTVRGDVVEISNRARLWQLLSGRELYLDPRAVKFRVERDYRRRERMVIVGVMTITSPGGLRPIWDALVAAVAEPTGDPPQDPRTSLTW
jgi:hypothetical protein